MNEFSFSEESEVVTWASEDPLPTETTSLLIPTHELVQPLSINIKVEQEAVSMEDSFLPEGDASMLHVSVETPLPILCHFFTTTNCLLFQISFRLFVQDSVSCQYFFF